MHNKKITMLFSAAMAAMMLMSGCASTSSGDSSATGSTSETATSAMGSYEDVYSIGLDKKGHYKDVKAKDIVTLPDNYTHIEIPESDLDLDESNVESTISQIANSFGDRVKADHAAREGDEVILDYVGTVDGVRFNGSTAGDAKLVLGSGSYVPGFEDQLIGRFAGECFDITVTFPDGYPDGEDEEGNSVALANKEVVFRTTVKEVDEIVLTDENVAENIATQDYTLNDGSEVNTVAKLKQYYTEAYTQDALTTAVYSYMIENSTISEIPENLIENMRDSYRKEINAAITAYNMTEEEYCQQAGNVDTIDELMVTIDDDIKDNITSHLIFQAVAEAQKMKVTNADVKEYFGGDDLSVQQATKYYGEAYLNQCVLFQEAYDWVVSNATIV